MSERASEPFIFIVAGVKLFQSGHLRGLFISHRTADTAAVRVRSQTMLERGGAAARQGARYRGEKPRHSTSSPQSMYANFIRGDVKERMLAGNFQHVVRNE